MDFALKMAITRPKVVRHDLFKLFAIIGPSTVSVLIYFDVFSRLIMEGAEVQRQQSLY